MSNTCSECGTTMAVGNGHDLCAACLLRLGLSNHLAASSSASGTSGNGDCRIVGDYEVLEEIARGGMGIVFRARQISLDRTVALKMTNGGQFASQEALKRFRTEAEAAASLEHPHIVTVHQFGTYLGQPYFSMRYVEGGSLAGRIDEFAPAGADGRTKIYERTSRIAQLMAKVARAVHYAHDNGVLHRDLKPANILLDANNDPHVTDFGIAKFITRDSNTTGEAEVLGTPSYMAPEQASGNGRNATRATDVFSLGAILYHLLTGSPPFRGDGPEQTLARVLSCNPAPPRAVNPHANPELSLVAMKCLEKDANDRYASAAELAEDLERWLRHEPVTAKAPSVLLRARRWSQRHPALATAYLLLIVAASVASGLISRWQWREANIREMRMELIRRLDALWAGTNAYVTVTAEQRAICWPAAIQSRATGPRKRYTIAVYAHEKPAESVEQFAPLLGYMERMLETPLEYSVVLDLRIYRYNSDAVNGLVRGEVDVIRLGAGPYVTAKELAPEISLIARQAPTQYIAYLFVRADTLFTNTADLKGRSFAFGHPDSTISGFHGRAFLHRSGLQQGDFTKTNWFGNHLEVLRAVAAGEFDAGFAKKTLFTKFTNDHSAALRVIAELKCTSMPWVAREGLDRVLVDELKHALLVLKDSTILKVLPDGATGFSPAADSDFDAIRKEKKHADEFSK